MIESITALLVCQLIGEVIARASGLPLPGPVIGMAILFAGLVIRGEVPEPLQQTTGRILEHLSLLFVPAGVGVMLYLPLVADQWLPITAAVVAGTLVTIAITAWVMSFMLRLQRRGGGGPGAGTS